MKTAFTGLFFSKSSLYVKRIVTLGCLIPLFFSNGFALNFIQFKAELADLPTQKTEKKNLPPVRWPRKRSFDVKHLALDLRFDWAKKQAFGTSSITLAMFETTTEISLDAAFMKIESVALPNGTPLKFDYKGGDANDNLQITLDRPYRTDENVTVKIVYHTNWLNQPDPNSLGGNNGKGLRFSAPTSNDPLKPREIWSFGDPETNRYWFPSYDAPNDLRTTELRATVPKELTVISNGQLVETIDNADDTRSFQFRADTPYANHLTSLVVGEFVNVKKKFADVELNNFGYPLEKDWVDASTERLPEMMSFFSELTGAKYPYPSYSQVFVQDIGSFTSGQNVSTITENMVDDFPTHADFFYLWDLTEAEALAGQWFGNYLSVRDWSEVWLNKSFAHYLNCLYTEHRNGRAERLLWIHGFDQNTYFADWSAGQRRPVVTRNYAETSVLTADNYATVRGALVLNLLHRHLGEEKWRRALRHYVRSNARRTVTTEDFRHAVEEATGESLGWFFDQWLYKMGHPVFEVTKNYNAQRRQLTLNVKQTQKTDPNNEYPQTDFFQGRIEIEIDGRLESAWLKPQAENVLIFDVGTEPEFVNFDFENAWIRELKFEKTFDEWLAQFENSKDVLAKQTALTELSRLFADEKTAPTVRAKIRTAFQKTVTGNEYWRLRNSAMFALAGLSATDKSDEAAVSTLLTVIRREKSWLRAGAIALLGNTRDPKFAELYIENLNDESFRVINSAAVALGKTKSPKAFEILKKLKDKPSMKSQTLLSALAGLKELGDPRGFEVAFQALSDLNLPRWRLPLPPVWDYRVTAAETIAALGQSEKAFPLVFERFKTSLAEDDLNGIFYNVVLINALADPRGREVFEMLKVKFKDDKNTLTAVETFEKQFRTVLKN